MRRRSVLRAVTAGWLLVVLVGEWLAMDMAALQCRAALQSGEEEEDGGGGGGPAYRMLIVADPQLTDHYSYRDIGWRLRARQWFCDVYMKRAYRAIQRWIPLHGVLFLGDLFDGGREWRSRSLFQEEWDRLRWVFPHYAHDRHQHFYVAGNHDIGFGDFVVESARDRFQRAFHTPLNYELDVAGHRLVVLDTVSLSAERAAIRTESATFLRRRQPGNATKPVIVVTHVPLYRPDSASCGNVGRTSRDIHQGRGYQYQNLVAEDISVDILKQLRPVLVLSGDDHDQCLHVHQIASVEDAKRGQDIPERSIGTFSWMQGNWYPSFGVLTLYPGAEPHRTIHVCMLPSQFRVFIAYACLALLTVVLILFLMARKLHIGAILGRRDQLQFGGAMLEKLESTSRMSTASNGTNNYMVPIWIIKSARACSLLLATSLGFYVTLHIIDRTLGS